LGYPPNLIQLLELRKGYTFYELFLSKQQTARKAAEGAVKKVVFLIE
jgi:hypothetical protein